jgi:hypothetical protein
VADKGLEIITGKWPSCRGCAVLEARIAEIDERGDQQLRHGQGLELAFQVHAQAGRQIGAGQHAADRGAAVACAQPYGIGLGPRKRIAGVVIGGGKTMHWRHAQVGDEDRAMGFMRQGRAKGA